MILAIKELGEMIKEDNILKSLVLLNDKIEYICKVNFDIINKKVDYEIEEFTEESLYEYLWIGGAGSGNTGNLQIFWTVNDFELIKKATIFNNALEVIKKEYKYLENKYNEEKKNKDTSMIENTKDIISLLKEDINKILEIFYDKKEENKKEEDNKKEEKKKEDSKYVLKEDYYKNYQKNLLFVILLNNELFYKKHNKLYEELVLNSLIYRGQYKFKKSNICSVCGNNGNVESEIYVYKFYNTDKKNTSQNLSEDFSNNFTICKDCYIKSLKAQRFIENYLNSKIGNLNFLIIPEFIFKEENFDLLKFKNIIINFFNPATNIESIYEFRTRIKQYFLFNKKSNNFILNYLFYRKKQSQFSIYKLIKDIEPTRVKEIFEKLIEINNNSVLFSIKTSIYLNTAYTLFINKKEDKKNDIYNYKYYIDILDSILSKKKINYNKLIENYIKGVNIIRFLNEDKNMDLRLYLVKCFYFLSFLIDIENIKMEDNNMREVNYILNLLEEKKKNSDYKKLHEFIMNSKEIINSSQKIALISIGFLISKIANAQDNSGLSNTPILNSIKYEGMKYSDILYLVNKVFEKLKQYKLIHFYDLLEYISTYYIAKEQKWQLSSVENVFYILTGYSIGSLYINEEKTNSSNNDQSIGINKDENKQIENIEDNSEED